MPTYHPTFLDHFEHPRNQGSLEAATHRGSAVDDACGDRLTLDLEVQEGRIRAARFRVQGCMGAIAVGSVLTELLPGRPFPHPDVDRAGLADALGDVPRAKRHALRLALAALSAARSIGG